MKKNKLIGVMAMLCLFLSASAQPAPTLKTLSIGDEVPDLTLTDVINAPSGKVSLRDYRGKVLIIDFWATWCTACLLNYPKLEHLKEKFSGKVAVLGVTEQPKEKIRQFFASPNGKKYRMVTVTGDKTLQRIFPHHGIPHYIVIDQQGVVRAITNPDGVSEANIQKLLSGQTIQAQVKKDLDGDRPLFLDEAYPSDNTIIKYSLLSKGYYSGLGSGNRRRLKGDKIIGVAVTNSNLLWMYETAAINIFWKTGDDFTDKRMLVKVADPAAISLSPSGKNDGLYKHDNAYNYDLILPEEQSGKLYETMLSELNELTPYHGVVEKRMRTCLVLRRTDSTDRIASKGTPAENTLGLQTPYRLINSPLRHLIIYLNDASADWPTIIDETGYAGKVDLVLPVLNDLGELRKTLKGYGLDLVLEKRPLLMLVLTDKIKPAIPAP